MRYRVYLIYGIAAIVLFLVFGVVGARADTPAAGAVTPTTFTYQGQLRKAETLVTAVCDMQFSLYTLEAGGSLIGSPVQASVPVTNGLFTAGLDFGASAFQGQVRWLEVAVRCPSDAGYTTLPRQAVGAAPYSLYALDADQLDGFHGSDYARIARYAIPGGGGVVTLTIPHYNAFQVTLGEAFASPGRAAWISAVENDGDIAWVGINGDGTIVKGSAVSLVSSTTVITLGQNIVLRCPGTGSPQLVLTSVYEDVRATVTW
jgi:hypothetical protein